MTTQRDAAFYMADIRSKRPTRRRAVAVGEFLPGPEVFATVVERRLPKGDALVMAEIAGLQGAKMAAMLMPLFALQERRNGSAQTILHPPLRGWNRAAARNRGDLNQP